MIIARQATARIVTVGPVLDADGVAVTDGVVGDFKISKNGGAPAALNASATLTHRHTGHYSLALTTSDLDTVGQAEIVIDDTTNACPMKAITVIEEAVYDIMFAASATGAVPVASIANNAITAAAINADAITAAKVAADVGTEIGTAVWGTTTRVLTAATNLTTALATPTNITAGTITTVTNLTNAPTAGDLTATMKASVNAEVDTALADYDGPTNAEMVARTLAAASYATATALQTVDDEIATIDGNVDAILADTADMQPKLGTPAVSISADIAAIEAQTDDIGAAGAGLTAVPWNAAWDAEVQSEVQDAIEANHLDHLLAATYDPASKPGAADALFNELVENDAGVARFTANALEQAPTGGSAPTVGEIADAVWDEDLTGHVTADTAGEILGNVATGTPPTAAAIADAVWDEAQADHVSAGTFGEVATETAAILVDTAVIGAAGAGLTEAGGTGDHLTALASQTSVNDLPTTSELATALAGADDATLAAIAALNNLSSAQAQTAAAAALTAYDPPTNAELEARTLASASYSTLTQAQVATEMSDALTADVVADSVPADGSRPTIAQAVYLLTQFMLERSVTGTTMTVRKPDGSTSLITLTLDDATTPTSVTRAT